MYELNTTFDHTFSTRDNLTISLSVWHLTVLLARIHTCQLRGRKARSQQTSQLHPGQLFFQGKKKSCPRWDSNPRHSVVSVSALPTELPRQLNRFISSTQYNTKSIQSCIYTEIHCPTLELLGISVHRLV